MNTKLIVAGKLIDSASDQVQEDMTIIVEGDRITGVEKTKPEVLEIMKADGTEVVDLTAYTVMPGLVDAHMHFFGVPSHKLYLIPTENESYRVLRAASEANAMLRAGITAARCLGSSVSPSLRRAINEGLVRGPRLVVSGEFICSSNGTWDHLYLPLPWMRELGMLADGADEVRQKVRERLRQGANVIKVGLSQAGVGDRYHPWGEDPYQNVPAYSLEEVMALTDEAHSNRVRVSAHCISDWSVRSALEAQVDVIEHGYPITEETRERVVESGTIVTTTASQILYHKQAAHDYQYADYEIELFDRHLDIMRENFEAGLAAGVKYALGTDLVGRPTHPQDEAAKEFEIVVNWGMTPMQAIKAGTAMSADALGMSDDIGTIEVGKLADLVALKDDPLKDITALQRIDFVMQGGEIIRHGHDDYGHDEHGHNEHGHDEVTHLEEGKW
jgi:imidazolonepropionase-like amidohydrolase